MFERWMNYFVKTYPRPAGYGFFSLISSDIDTMFAASLYAVFVHNKPTFYKVEYKIASTLALGYK